MGHEAAASAAVKVSLTEHRQTDLHDCVLLQAQHETGRSDSYASAHAIYDSHKPIQSSLKHVRHKKTSFVISSDFQDYPFPQDERQAKHC